MTLDELDGNPWAGALCAVRRHWLALVAAALAGGLGAAWMASISGERYESDAELLVRPGWDHALRPQAQGADEWPTIRLADVIDSEVRILSSRGVKEAVLDRIGLGTLYPDLDGDTESTSYIDSLRGIVGLPTREPLRVGPSERRTAALARLEEALTVRAAGDSGALLVSFQHPDRHLASHVLEELIEAYRNRRADLFIREKVEVAKARIARARTELEASRLNLTRHVDEAGTALASEQLDRLSNEVGRLDVVAREAETKATEQRQVLAQTLEALQRPNGSGASSGATPVRLSDRLEVSLRDHFHDAAVLAHADPDGQSPAAAALRRRDDAMAEQLRQAFPDTIAPDRRDSLVAAFLMAGRREAEAGLTGDSARAAIAAATPELLLLRVEVASTDHLAEAAAAAQERYDTASALVQDTEVAADLARAHVGGIELLDRPSEPTAPVGLGFAERIALGSALGAALAGCAVVLSPLARRRHRAFGTQDALGVSHREVQLT